MRALDDYVARLDAQDHPGVRAHAIAAKCQLDAVKALQGE